MGVRDTGHALHLQMSLSEVPTCANAKVRTAATKQREKATKWRIWEQKDRTKASYHDKRLECCFQAAQEYRKPHNKAVKIQVWLQQANALFNSQIPSDCWRDVAEFPDDLMPETPEDVAAMTQRWQAAVKTLLLELETRQKACRTWLRMYLGDRHVFMAEHLLGLYATACDRAACVISELPKGMRCLEDQFDLAIEASRQLCEMQSAIASAHSVAVEAVDLVVSEVRSAPTSLLTSLFV